MSIAVTSSQMIQYFKKKDEEKKLIETQKKQRQTEREEKKKAAEKKKRGEKEIKESSPSYENYSSDEDEVQRLLNETESEYGGEPILEKSSLQKGDFI